LEDVGQREAAKDGFPFAEAPVGRAGVADDIGGGQPIEVLCGGGGLGAWVALSDQGLSRLAERVDESAVALLVPSAVGVAVGGDGPAFVQRVRKARVVARCDESAE
jgi:hypothetical protein